MYKHEGHFTALSVPGIKEPAYPAYAAYPAYPASPCNSKHGNIFVNSSCTLPGVIRSFLGSSRDLTKQSYQNWRKHSYSCLTLFMSWITAIRCPTLVLNKRTEEGKHVKHRCHQPVHLCDRFHATMYRYALASLFYNTPQGLPFTV